MKPTAHQMDALRSMARIEYEARTGKAYPAGAIPPQWRAPLTYRLAADLGVPSFTREEQP